uniref:DNA-directed DNA polymerase n=1 Tax=Panagrolaimus superbus TaxID=310955 RepID=A0A914ZC36_9BILA
MGRNSDIKYYSLVLRGSTIASLALYIFRLKYLKWETVALVPESGYQSTINQSKIAIAYMNFLVHKKKAAGIMHRDNGGEKKFGDMFVDGFDHVNNVVYQVMGCMYHGCIKCRQADRSIIQWVGKSAAQLYAETVARQKKLRENLRPGIQIVEIWECEIAAERKLDAELDKFIKEHEDTSPINLRRVVSLWTTAAAKLHLYKFMKYLELDPNSVILYTDTDSIIYAHKKTVPNPLEAGDLLGQMTDEYPQKSITHYRSGGAKQYYLKYKDAKTGEKGHCCKIRGIVANAETERVITYKTLKYKPTRITTLDHTTIGPHHDFTILTRNTTKIYRTTCKKG